MQETAKKLLRNKMVPSVLSIILGIVLIIAQKTALVVLVRAIGILLLIGAIGFVIQYFTSAYRDSLQLVTAGFGLLAGLLLMHFAENVVNFFPMLMGIVLILNGLSDLAMAMSTVLTPRRNADIAMAILIIVLGLLLLLHPGAIADAIVLYVGIFYVISGIANLFMLYRVKSYIVK